MYKLLIVDDEPLVQVGIKSMLDWNALDIEVVGTASNGEAALKIIEDTMPDIVITDIQMPILSGLELIRICRERFGAFPVFLILTSYQDFEMAKQAIAYQVTDYLVKLELDADTLRETIMRTLPLVDKEKKTAPPEHAISPAGLIQERFFIRLVNNLFENEAEYLMQKDELSLAFTGNSYTAGYFLIDTPAAAGMNNSQLLSLYQATLHMFIQLIAKYIPCYVTPLDVRHFLIVFPLQTADTHDTDWHREILRALNGTCTMLKNYYNASIRAGIGHPVSNPFDLSGSFFAAKQVSSEATDETPFLFSDEQQHTAIHGNAFNISIWKADIRSAYEEMDAEKLHSIFASITELFSQHPSHHLQAMDAAGSILYLTLSLLSDGERTVSDIFASDPAGYRCLYQMNSTEQIIGWMQTLCDGLCDFFSSEKDNYKNHVVTNVKAYINRNLDQKLSLNEVAAAFDISPAYLSKLFGKYSELGFVNYVNYAKINAAKEMLRESNDKVYEIAAKLGFESAFYFSKVFKKIEGCSPREYMQKP